jgi:monothiol glutaredoxin
VMLFMKGNRSFPQCGFSAAVVEVLKKHGVQFNTFNVLSDMNVREGLKEYSQWPTIPQLYVDGEFVGGCDIVREMDASGELTQLLHKDETQPT